MDVGLCGVEMSGSGARDEVLHLFTLHAPLVGGETEVGLIHVGPERRAVQLHIFHLISLGVFVVEVSPAGFSLLFIFSFGTSPHQTVSFFEGHGHHRNGTTSLFKMVLMEGRSELLAFQSRGHVDDSAG